MQGWQKNSSEIVVERFQSTLQGKWRGMAEIESLILPTSSRDIQSFLEDLLSQSKPDVCLFLGQAKGRSKITVELFATNLLHLEVADGSGFACQRQEILPGTPVAYSSNLPSQELLVESLQANGIPAGYSCSAGTSLCNQILYTGLHLAEMADCGARCGFVHLPILPEQAIEQWPESPFMSLEMQLKGLEVILDCIVAQSPACK